MEMKTVEMTIPEGCNIILGQTHFIKTAEDLYEIMATGAPQAEFGIAFTEASGPCLVRTEGNSEELVKACTDNLLRIGAGHIFCILMRKAFPIGVLNQIKQCQEVCRIFCATANPLHAVITAAHGGAAVLGVIDGASPKGVESGQDRDARKEFLRKIGYKR